ncbi:heavy metal translocating P-type ATPase metal-binding domain-containing protein [Bdellovibrionota bacterium FG-1]
MISSESVGSTSAVLESRRCLHCSTGVPSRMRSQFCCAGCETVYKILQGAGLSRYYDIRSQTGSSFRPIGELEPSVYDYLDQVETRALYEKDGAMRFYLEGVHCAACVWLVEKLPRLVPGVESVRLDLSSAVATVRLGTGGGFYGAAAEEFLKLGYRAHPIKTSEAEVLRKKEDRRLLIQLGIAGAAAGNLMILAISLYAGADGRLAQEFRWASFLLCLPVIFYCAQPFYRSSWAALRMRQLSIDVPIAVGVGVSYAVSVVNLFRGDKRIYFDSVASLVFLLLASRYFLRRVQLSSLNASSLAHFLIPSLARLRSSQGGGRVRVEDLVEGDTVEVWAGECIPVDGEVLEGRSAINASLLTGEARPERVDVGMGIFAGTLNLQSPLVIRVSRSGRETRVGKIFESMEASLQKRAPIVAFSDRVSQGFIALTLLLLPLVFVAGWSGGWEEALSRALAVALVTCPCAFALATPLTFAVSLGRCARGGVLIKGADVLERLSRIKTVFLDKTGTLTEGRFSVLTWQSERPEAEIAEVIVALESRSVHPIAQALMRHFKPLLGADLPEVSNFIERMGEGVSGVVSGQSYRLGAADVRGGAVGLGAHSNDPETRVSLWGGLDLLGTASLGDPLRQDTGRAIDEMRSLGLKLAILSGDSAQAVAQVARRLGVDSSFAFSGATPERKKAVVGGESQSLMVGDGANDAVALASAFVSMAVHGGLEASIRAADVYLSRPGLIRVPQVVRIARETMKVVRRNFFISLIYNMGVISAAATGKVSPLFAAVLMPISAFAVFASATWGTRSLREALKEESP